MITREQALDIIRMVWGERKILSQELVEEIERNKLEGDRHDLDTCARLAELPEVLDIPSYNNSAVVLLCERVRAERNSVKPQSVNPDSCLNEIRALYSKQLSLGALIVQDQDRLAVLLKELDTWLSSGGCTPQEWSTPPILQRKA